MRTAALAGVALLQASFACAGDDVHDAQHQEDVPEPSAFEWSLLDRDVPIVANPKSVDLTRGTKSMKGGDSSWNRDDKPNGSSDVSIKQSIVPFWDSRAGADIKVVTQTPSTSSDVLTEKLSSGGQLQHSSGAAWVAATAPGVASIWDKTAIEARVDPGLEQARLGTSLSKSVPLVGNQYSLTIQNGYNITDQASVPLAGTHSTRTYGTDQSAKFNFLSSGTSVIAGQALSTTDERWLRTIGAEQKLFDGLSISGTVSETPWGASNKTLSAGFKRSW